MNDFLDNVTEWYLKTLRHKQDEVIWDAAYYVIWDTTNNAIGELHVCERDNSFQVSCI